MIIINRPQKLVEGDIIGVIAPGSPTTMDKVNKAKNSLEELGFEVKLGESCYEKDTYLAGDDNLRANDVNEMFLDDNVKGIICLRGGYGTSRILNLINYRAIKKHPKVFVGYSDITALHIAFNQLSNMVTYHGPMAGDMLEGMDEFTKKSFFYSIQAENEICINNPKSSNIECLCPGVAKGKIIGGNLSLIISTLGTPYEINTKGKILFIEEVRERPYVIDRLLMQLKHAKKFQDAKGIILGDFKDCVPKENEDSKSLEEVFNEIIKPLNKPTIYKLKAGHCNPMVTLPFGLNSYMDADRGVLISNI
ncbi:muramoyltetrapeptide carboxypeptidase [Vallitalea longa]|uniref:Muramoyltetrapeptide carboxypeptidase n=1 Tax=Vallitalea longa TaxID=2936439 RepID=A0A9W6DHQ1_9FIRM|nr:LD-carboxypeptidase [Vallitalea longa]GKX31802.1 muramoyltetrapeptide carboxypeptidase [Vallitalea longa]